MTHMSNLAHRWIWIHSFSLSVLTISPIRKIENNYFNQKFYHFTFLFKKLEILNGDVLGTLVLLFQL